MDIGNDRAAIARLVRQEREVAALVALRLPDAEIARRLAITEGAVADHVASGFRRLALRGRARIVAWSVELDASA